MDHETMSQLIEDLGEIPGFCNICKKWYGESKLRKFMGTTTCFTCYQRFKKYLEEMDTEDAIKWFFKRIDAEATIKTQGDRFVIHIKVRQKPPKLGQPC